MRARACRKVTITTAGVNIADITQMPPAERLLYYATGGNNIALDVAGSSYAAGYPIAAGKPDFKDLDQSSSRYAYADSGTQVLFILEFEY